MQGLNKHSSWRSFFLLLAKDVRSEFHSLDLFSSMGMYALVVLVIYGASLSQNAPGNARLSLGSGLLWSIIVFTALLGINRSSLKDRENGCLEALILMPLDRGLIFLAKTVSTLIFLLVVEACVLPLFFVLFLSSENLAATWPYIGLVLLVGTLGLAGTGTLLSGMSAQSRRHEVILSVMLVPLLFPLLYSCVSASSLALTGAPAGFESFWQSLGLAGAFDVVMLSLAWLLYDVVVSA